MSLIPSVCFLIDIPESIESSWYNGKVLVGLKDAVFEPSFPARHAAELHEIILSNADETKPMLFVYTDGDPDHRLTYLSVHLFLISLFLKLDLDFLCACRTAPFHSWRNPVERLMSILNLGLQSVGLMRKEAAQEYEESISKCNNIKELKKMADKCQGLSDLDSLSPVKVLLSDIVSRLKLKNRPFEVYTAASTVAVEDVWSSLHSIDASLSFTDKHQKDSLKALPLLMQFLDPCCQQRH